MIKASDLCGKCRIPLNEGWGYIWGAYGQVHTQAVQDKATRAQTKKWGQQWVGKRVLDCSGLLYWAFKELGGYMYHGSNTIFKSYTTATGKIKAGVQLKPGTAVFLTNGTDRHHVGLYVGDGKVIEAKGTYYGVVSSAVTSWDEWGTLKGVDYDGNSDEVAEQKPTLRKGSSGDAVKLMQTLLGQHGYAVTPDGVFGAGTLTAVQNFQTAKGLKADGVCGPLTWAALGDAPADPVPVEDDEPAEEKTEPVKPETNETLAEINRLLIELNGKITDYIKQCEVTSDG